MNMRAFGLDTRIMGSQVTSMVVPVSVLVAATMVPSLARSQTGPIEVLTNESVIQMVVGKVPKDLTKAKIQSTRNTFDMSAEGLVRLDQNKVDDDLISAMLKATASDRKGTLTDEDVIYMVAHKLPKRLMLERIQSSSSGFDLTAAGLVNLSTNKVSQDVIKAMMAVVPAKEVAPPPMPRAPSAQPNNVVASPPTSLSATPLVSTKPTKPVDQPAAIRTKLETDYAELDRTRARLLDAYTRAFGTSRQQEAAAQLIAHLQKMYQNRVAARNAGLSSAGVQADELQKTIDRIRRQ